DYFRIRGTVTAREIAQAPIDLRLPKNRSCETTLLIELGDGSFTKGRQFVQKAIAIHATGDDHSTTDSQSLKHARDRLAQARLRHSNKLRRGSRRIQQRPKEIEDRALPTFRAELARRRDVLEGRVIFWREE